MRPCPLRYRLQISPVPSRLTALNRSSNPFQEMKRTSAGRLIVARRFSAGENWEI